jgi:hypothetical protein
MKQRTGDAMGPLTMEYEISRAEQKAYRSRLSEWNTPRRFIETADELTDRISALQVFSPHGVFARDAWVAARFVSASPRTPCVSAPTNGPDFETRTRGAIQRYEVTEADILGRRRHDEYKALARSERDFDFWTRTAADWRARAEQVPLALQHAAELKAQKCYATNSARLVVSLNMNTLGYRQKEIEAAMPAATAVAKDTFSQVWVLWTNHLYLLWNGGSPVFDLS